MRTEDWGGFPGSLSLSFSSKYKLHHLPLHNCLKLKLKFLVFPAETSLLYLFETCDLQIKFLFGQFIPL